MQTDPNWGNFLYSPTGDRLGLIDFGASREYKKGFIDGWYALLSAAIRGDKERMINESRNIGYFTGEEEQVSSEVSLLFLIPSTPLLFSLINNRFLYPLSFLIL